MMNSNSEAMNILQNAIKMELEGQRLFQMASERMSHPRAKEMFSNLVKQEKRHVQIIGGQIRRMDAGLGWSSVEAAKADGSSDSDVSVFTDGESIVNGLDASAGELEVIKLGMDVEKRSIDYYSDARSRVTDDNARKIFDWLVEEEKGHLVILKAEFDSRSGSGFYYDNQEFSLEVE